MFMFLANEPHNVLLYKLYEENTLALVDGATWLFHQTHWIKVQTHWTINLFEFSR